MPSGLPDTSLLSRLLRGRIAAGRHPLTGKAKQQDENTESASETSQDTEQRSSAVIGALMRDTREAYDRQQHQPSLQSDAAPPSGAIQSDAQTNAQLDDAAADPGDLSGFALEVLNDCEWDDWVSARCDFPASGPFVVSGSAHALDAIAQMIEQVLVDASEDGEDLTVHVFTGAEAGSARIAVTGPFNLSIQTLTMIKKHRRTLESVGGALYTVRSLSSAGFEALIPER